MGDKSVSALRRVSDNFRKISARLEIANHGLHSLRRFCVTRQLRDGVDIDTIAQFMGYSYSRYAVRRDLRCDARWQVLDQGDIA
jgi:hypothetical protein